MPIVVSYVITYIHTISFYTVPFLTERGTKITKKMINYMEYTQKYTDRCIQQARYKSMQLNL